VERAFGPAIAPARRAITRAAASIDRTVMRWAEGVVPARAATASSRRPADGGALRARMLEIAAAYSTDTAGVPSRFFPSPEATRMRLLDAGGGAGGSRVWDLSQPSGYQPFWSQARDAYLSHRENLTSHARWWTVPGPRSRTPRPALIVIHGWRGGAYWMTERVFEISYWLRHGFDVVAFQLPFHGQRTPAASNGQSGELFLSGNAARTNEAFGHAVYDLRALAAELRVQHGVRQLGVLGMSLGGYTGALWASVCDDLDFALATIPAVSMPTLILRPGSESSLARRLRDAGVDDLLLHEVFAVHSPLARPPRLPAERLFVIAGDGDQITPAEQARALIDHWGCQSYWFAGGHLAQVGRHQALRAARLHLRAHGICGE
jgi:pimeloyl-ACP methyl ester carboxylesterase